MPWWQFVITELLKIIPDIIAWIQGSSNPAQAATDFITHVASFKKS